MSDAGAATPPVEVRVVRDARDLDGLEAAWDELVEECLEPSPFVTFPWLREWWRAFGADREMHLVTVWQGEQLRAVAPLAYRTRKVHGRRLRELSLWSNAYSNRIHFIVHRESPWALGRIVDHILEQAPAWDLWILEPVLLDSGLSRGLLDQLEAHGLRHGVRDVLRSPFLALPKTADALLAGLSSGFRKSLRRKVRAQSEAAKPDGAKLRSSIRGDAAALDAAFEVALESWQHDEGTSIASTETLIGFYRGVSREAEKRGWLQIALLEDATGPLSFEYNLVFRGVVHNLKLGYRADSAERSPGLLLKHHVLSQAIEAGRSEYDFLGMDEHYKTQWSSGIREHVCIEVFGARMPLPAVHFFRYRVKPAVRVWLPSLVAIKNAVMRRLRGNSS